MSIRQWKRWDAVERVGKSELTMAEAAQVVGLSERQWRRVCRAVDDRGMQALVHGNRDRAPPNGTDEEVRQYVAELMRTTYVGFNDTHFTEKLLEEEGIILSRQTVQRVLRSAGVAPARRRRPRKYRRRRERRPQVGQMLQWDGSPHAWLEGRGPVLCLMAAIDDATGDIMPGAHFVEHECSASYLRVLLAVTEKHGLPWSMYMDRHSSLKRNDDHWTVEEELRGKQDPTQVARALEALDIELIYALSPEAKGRIERLWGTLQDRLVSELRLAGARTLTEANAVLAAFVPTFNERFGRAAADPQPAWRPVPKGTDLERTCSFLLTPKVDRDNTISVQGTELQLPAGPVGCSYAGRRVEARLLLNGEIRVYVDNKQITWAKIDAPRRAPQQRKRQSKRRSSWAVGPREKKLTFKQIVAKVRQQKNPTTRADRIAEQLARTY